ncbi:hypothetical protein BsWGS_16014 [Bradybaena similaris]
MSHGCLERKSREEWLLPGHQLYLKNNYNIEASSLQVHECSALLSPDKQQISQTAANKSQLADMKPIKRGQGTAETTSHQSVSATISAITTDCHIAECQQPLAALYQRALELLKVTDVLKYTTYSNNNIQM